MMAPGSTPYVTPEILTSAPTGIAWKTIPRINSTALQQEAEQINICSRATSMTDSACGGVLRATIDTETIYGPDYRMTVQPWQGNCRVVLQRWPIIDIMSGQLSNSAAFPPQWQTIAANQFIIEHPILGSYGTAAPSDTGDGGQSILLAPGYVTWENGRLGYALQVTYVNGWPHTALTATAVSGSTTLTVNDTTGWAPFTSGGLGMTGLIFDGADQETINCTASTTTSGPGTLTLAAATTFTHQHHTVVTTLPQQIMEATILFATYQALTRGATATTVQTISGTGSATASGGYDLVSQAKALLAPYRRTI
jgi:hypothetical protein